MNATPTAAEWVSPAAPMYCSAAEFVFDAATVSGDFLLAAFQWIDPEDPKRRSLTLNLNTAEIDGNADLVSCCFAVTCKTSPRVWLKPNDPV